MDPISNVDQLVLLLRQRLAERSRAASSGKTGQVRSARETASAEVDSAHALAAIDGVDERQLKRALIQNILADQLGGALLNDAQFQQVVDRVTETIGRDDDFFELGGHSLLAVQVAVQIQEIVPPETPAANLYETPTVRELAAFLSGAEA